MRVTKTVQVPATERIDTIGIRCDVCGKEHLEQGGGSWPEDTDKVSRLANNQIEVTVEIVHRAIGWEGDGQVYEESWDLCPGCFDEIIRKPLVARGAKPLIKECDY